MRGAALAFQRRSDKRLLAPLTSTLWMEAMPVVSGGDAGTLLEFLRLIEAHARDGGITELSVGSFGSPYGSSALGQLGFILTKRMEFELNLEKSEDDLWNGVEYKRRKNIKKAIRMSVSVRDLPAAEGMSHLRRLQAESSRRIVHRGGPDITYKGEEAKDPAVALVDAGVGRIVVAEVAGEVVSAGLFTCFNGMVYHTLSGHAQKALETQAPTFLLWEVIKQYRNLGVKRFNFGGCSAEAANETSAEHGIYEYKKAFGGSCLECASGTKVLRKVAHAIMGAAKAILRRR